MSSLFGRKEDINQSHMSIRLNISNMKINHRSRKSHMSEALLHVHYVLSVFQEIRGRTMPQFVDGDGMVECNPRQCVLGRALAATSSVCAREGVRDLLVA